MQRLKIGAYIRVSTDDQVNVYEGSLDSQKFRIQEFVEYKNRQLKNWGEIIEFYVEEGESAGTTNRRQYQRLMSDVRSGKINLILVSDLTRLSRNLLDFCTLINELEAHKASYLSMKEQFDTSTPIGRMMVYIIIALGQFEREQTSERVSINCHARALRGLVNGGPAPLGFDKHPEKKGLLVVNEAEAKVVKLIFETFLESGSRAKTIDVLHAKSIFPKKTSKKGRARGAAPWTVQSLKAVLTNTGYIGFREVNKVYKEEDEGYLKPWQRYQLVKAAWPAIIEESLFFDAQKLLEEASSFERERMAKSEKREFLCTGLLTCGETGLPLVGQVGHGRDNSIYRYYHYVRRPKFLSEVRPRLNADDLEEKVINELKSALKTAGYFVDLERTLKEQHKSQSKSTEGEYNRAKRELDELSERFENLLANQGRMKLSDEALRITSDQLNTLAKRRKDIEAYLKNLKHDSSSKGSPQQQLAFVQNQIKALIQGWDKSSSAAKKRLLRRTIKSIVVTRDSLNITFWLNPDDMMEVNHTEGSVIPFRRNSPKTSDRNLLVDVSGKVGIGSEGRT